MGIILGALGGAGEAVSDYVDKRMVLDDKQLDRDSAMDKLRLDSQLTQQRAEAMELFKADLANSQRGQMVARVQGAAGDIADEQMAPKIAQEQAGIVDPDSWTPEQQAAVDQSNAIDRKGIINQALTDGSAGLRSGDIGPEKAMENTSKLQMNEVKMQSLLDRANDRNLTMQQIADVKAEAMRYGYELRLEGAKQKALNGHIDTATGRMLITSEDANIKASTQQMQMLARELENTPKKSSGKDNPRVAEIQQQIDGLRGDIANSKANKQIYLRSMNLPGAGGDGTPGTTSTVNGAPYAEGTKLTGPGGAPYIVQGGVPVPLQ